MGHPPWGDSPAQPPSGSDELVGTFIAGGKYQILRALGEGGMGVVYRALQPAMNRMVALKLIRPEMVTKAEVVARFHKEMMVTARIEHPNTVRVYDFGDDGGQLYLAMELLGGVSLRQVVEITGRLDVARIVRIGKQVANALGAIHRHGIVHRDLKPDNVMLLDGFGERDFVKVLDFGLAKVLEDQVRLTATGKPIGTPTYMAPEQARGLAVSPRTDLYALGVMLYQMASGRAPFEASTAGTMLLAHAQEAPAPILAREPGIPPALAALIMQLLEKDPGARPASAAEVAARLDLCLHAAMSPAARRGRRSILLVGALAGALVAASAAIAYLAVQRLRDHRAPATAIDRTGSDGASAPPGDAAAR